MGRHHDILFQGWQTKCQNDWVVPGNFSTRYLSSKETEENNDGFVLFSEYWRKCQCSLQNRRCHVFQFKKGQLEILP